MGSVGAATLEGRKEGRNEVADLTQLRAYTLPPVRRLEVQAGQTKCSQDAPGDSNPRGTLTHQTNRKSESSNP